MVIGINRQSNLDDHFIRFCESRGHRTVRTTQDVVYGLPEIEALEMMETLFFC